MSTSAPTSDGNVQERRNYGLASSGCAFPPFFLPRRRPSSALDEGSDASATVGTRVLYLADGCK